MPYAMTSRICQIYAGRIRSGQNQKKQSRESVTFILSQSFNHLLKKLPANSTGNQHLEEQALSSLYWNGYISSAILLVLHMPRRQCCLETETTHKITPTNQCVVNSKDQNFSKFFQGRCSCYLAEGLRRLHLGSTQRRCERC